LEQDQARDLLDRVGVLRHPCDLDLLVFFARHPRTLMTSEQLAALTGYGVQQTAKSLDRLLKAELLTRTQNPRHAARMYVFAARTTDGSLAPLLELGSTRRGRLALRGVLAPPPAGRTGVLITPAATDVPAAKHARPLLARQRSDAAGERSADDRRRGGT
jgi:MarR family protein